MNVLDIIFLVIIGFFTAKGFMRGLIKEMASIIGLFLGFYMANTYYPVLSPYMARVVTTAGYVHAASYLLIFVLTMVLVWCGVVAVTALLKLTMLESANHAVGGAFGLAKGVLICSIILIALNMFMPKADFLVDSTLAPHLKLATSFMSQLLPAKMKDTLFKKGTAQAFALGEPHA